MRSLLTTLAIVAVLALPCTGSRKLFESMSGNNKQLIALNSDSCCTGWSRRDGSKASAPCFTPVCEFGCGIGEFCVRPEFCLCVSPYTVCRQNNGKRSSLTELAKQSDKKQKLTNVQQHNKMTCPVDLPQFVSASCLADRQNELTQSRSVYTVRQTPDFDDPGRDPTVLVAPLWDTDVGTAFGVALGDPVESPWFFRYSFHLQTMNQLSFSFPFTGNNSLRDFTVLDDYKALFFFFHDFNVVQGTVPTTPSDLTVDSFNDDKVFAEQRLAGHNPLQISRVFERDCPRYWRRIGNNCYKLIRRYYYTTWKKAYYVCKKYGAQLPILSDEAEAEQVNNIYKGHCSRIHVGGKYGKWLDGSDVENAWNYPSYFKRCLSARFSRYYGMHLWWSSCYSPARRILCQKKAIVDGTPLSEIRPFLNFSFSWKRAIKSKLRSNSSYCVNTVSRAIQDGRVFVMQFPKLRGLPEGPDINAVPNDGRELISVVSPIAIFVSNPDVNNGELLPVAIQVNSTPTAEVFTPDDGDNWSIAKTKVQVATYTQAQLDEQLLRTHFIMDPICVTANRHLALKHPLRQILRRHCVGTLTVNKFAELGWISQFGQFDNTATAGFIGAIEYINRAYNQFSFKDFNTFDRLKRQGVTDKNILPYYPYRDDGKKVFDLIGDFAKEYIDLYYDSDTDVGNDFELQAWADELSRDATGTPNSGNGKLKDFPVQFQSKKELVNAIQLILWAATGQHAAINYPVIEYGTYIPNMPGKYYNVENITGFQPVRFPNRDQSITQTEFGNVQGAFRFDTLFDYSSVLEDPAAQTLVTDFSNRATTLETDLIATNQQNIADGHLSYRYLFPSNIPNSIGA